MNKNIILTENTGAAVLVGNKRPNTEQKKKKNIAFCCYLGWRGVKSVCLNIHMTSLLNTATTKVDLQLLNLSC